MSSWSHASNFALLIFYLFLGGFIFKALEWQHEVDMRQMLVDTYNNLTITASQDGCIDLKDVKNLVTLTLTAQRYGIREWGDFTMKSQWNYFGSLFFSLVVVSTVGYGNMSPSTIWGRRMCVVYAFFGIPIFLNAVAQFSAEAKQAITRLQDKLARKKPHRRALAAAIMFTLGTFVAFFPNFLFMYCENWSFEEAAYFTFITLTTVGFGDYVAGAQTFYFSTYRFFLILWMLLGLMYVALIIMYVQSIMQYVLRKIASERSTTKVMQVKS
uniref:Potassium channel domain-containing protein n=1 Tax=Romanomermis culicivorax TaxID=13658 RepID=A0A915KU79_ROMCU